MTRLKRLLHGQTCRSCGTRRRIRWFLDSGCCSRSCLEAGLFMLSARRGLG